MNNRQFTQLIIEDSKEQIKILDSRISDEKDKDQADALKLKRSHHKFMVDRLKHNYLK